MVPKNEVDVPGSGRSVPRTVQDPEIDLQIPRGMPDAPRKAVQALARKVAALRAVGMTSSAARLERQAAQIVRRHRQAAKSGPNPLTGQ